MSRKHIKWLASELPGLVGAGVISEETADKLRGHYGEVDPNSGRRIALTICSILGSLLIGAGIILLLAHNWRELSRLTRTILSIAPLAISQVIALWVVWSGKDSSAWREGVATFLTLAIGASISLVAQTYHIHGDLGSFLLTWSVLSLPLVYLLNASLPAIIYLVGITSWSGYEQNCAEHAILFWPLLAAIIPHVWMETRKDVYATRSTVLRWALAVCLTIATGIVLEKVVPGLWLVVYSSLFAVMYLAGARWFSGADSIFRKPFHTIGSAGIAILAFVFTYESPWHEIGWYHYRHGSRFYEWAAVPDYLLTIALLVSAVYLFVAAFREGERYKLLLGVFPILTVCTYSLASADMGYMGAVLLFNVYLLVLGVGTMVNGVRNLRLSSVNGGMFVISALIVGRFFDSDIGFVARGVVFIVLGTGFLAGNIILSRKMKGNA